MSQRTRILIAIAAIVVIIGGVIGFDQLRRQRQATVQPDLAPGAIPIYVNGKLTAGFVPDDLDQLEGTSFVDDEEGKTQEGWLLRDVLLLYVEPDRLTPDTTITVSSSSRDKFVDLTWTDVDNADNMVMLDLSGRGTLKLVSQRVAKLDVRDEWVQDTDRIDISTP
jgi:hypothetical protein